MVDKEFCMASYLMFRYIYDNSKQFWKDMPCNIIDLQFKRRGVKTAEELIDALTEVIRTEYNGQKMALALSGGIDSAILAKLVPHDTKAYTFRCVVPNKKVIDESETAAKWAKINNLQHEVINITWEDVESVVDKLMLHKGAPIHSIEAQIYIAAEKAKNDGFKKFIFGENADIIYGGMDGLLKKDWLFGEFVDRYTYVKPYHVLKTPKMILEPYKEFEKDGHIDGHDFINKYFRQEALGTYNNACETAGVEFVGPYSLTYFDAPLDYNRVRSGDTKYIIREAFSILYPNEEIPKKIPMPRPVEEWFFKWTGPTRGEFLPHCSDNMSGDQKWMIWSLERFLNICEGKEYESSH